MSDISEEEFKKMGFKKFRVINGNEIHPDDIKAFLKWDAESPTKEEIEAAKRSIENYKRFKVKPPR